MQTALSSKGQPKVVNRWLVIFGTALVQLGVGTFYAWSIFRERKISCVNAQKISKLYRNRECLPL